MAVWIPRTSFDDLLNHGRESVIYAATTAVI